MFFGAIAGELKFEGFTVGHIVQTCRVVGDLLAVTLSTSRAVARKFNG